jgi:hypothetical protein
MSFFTNSLRDSPMPLLSVRAVAPLAAALALLAGCEDENNDPVTPVQEGTIQIDASTQTAYFSFADDTVVAVTNPGASTAWDMSFRRFTVGLNGGVAGSKGVEAYNLENNAAATPEQVIGFTPENQRAAFDAIDASDIPADAEFGSDELAPTFTAWFIPTPTGLNANPQAAWKFRRATAAGTHAVFRVVRIVNESANPSPTDGMAGIDIEYRLQAAGGTLGAPDTVQVTMAPGGTATINLTAGTFATGGFTQDCSWDLRVSRAYELLVNTSAGCNAGTFPLRSGEAFATLTTAADASQYAPFVSVISGPIPATFDDPRGPFLYGLDNDQLLYPTFNIYLVKVGDAVYKVQLTDYYSATGQSGFPTMRYERLR